VLAASAHARAHVLKLPRELVAKALERLEAQQSRTADAGA
jgi:hypothetical protein